MDRMLLWKNRRDNHMLFLGGIFSSIPWIRQELHSDARIAQWAEMTKMMLRSDQNHGQSKQRLQHEDNPSDTDSSGQTVG